MDHHKKKGLHLLLRASVIFCSTENVKIFVLFFVLILKHLSGCFLVARYFSLNHDFISKYEEIRHVEQQLNCCGPIFLKILQLYFQTLTFLSTKLSHFIKRVIKWK